MGYKSSPLRSDCRSIFPDGSGSDRSVSPDYLKTHSPYLPKALGMFYVLSLTGKAFNRDRIKINKTLQMLINRKKSEDLQILSVLTASFKRGLNPFLPREDGRSPHFSPISPCKKPIAPNSTHPR
ncbi:MAG: hypothetical protein D6728_14590 [Cyanobacteria bacterium J055]|nr:MAG: hypothetical protein D6728_14590 [Cyanobacteria bacterium J055]